MGRKDRDQGLQYRPNLKGYWDRQLTCENVGSGPNNLLLFN